MAIKDKDSLMELSNILKSIADDGLYKSETIFSSPQDSYISIGDEKRVLNFCSNNYLGLSNNDEVKNAAIQALSDWGYGLSSVRFICGTQEIHKQLENKLSEFLQTDDTILYSSCFDANGGLFETILNEKDFVVSDELNHASIIDGIRLCKAARVRYKNNDPADLESKLKEIKCSGKILVVTDGVFSMDGIIANLAEILNICRKYNALLMVDDSHAVGVLGKSGRGTHEHHGLLGQIDILSGTFGKALGGASGGYISGRREIVELLRQRSRPYLFSNSLAPMIVVATLKALELIQLNSSFRDRLAKNTLFFRNEITKIGLEIVKGEHPIVPIMLGDAHLAGEFSQKLLEKNVLAVNFSFPVVPRGKARIRTQVSAAHSQEDLEYAVKVFQNVKNELLNS